METTHPCFSCVRGEIYDCEGEGPYIVRNPEGGRIEGKGYLCEEHYAMYADDGFLITPTRV